MTIYHISYKGMVWTVEASSYYEAVRIVRDKADN